MTFHLYSPSHFEKWDFRNPESKGIGGSETAHIEIAIRLAKLGHTVFSYSPLPKDSPRQWANVNWCDLREADFAAPGIWIVSRAPQIFDNFKLHHPIQKLWLVMQDTQYPKLTKQRALKCDVFFALCEQHVIVTQNDHPEIADRVVLSANGIRSEVIDWIEKENIERDPHRLMYASSPDRGLMNLLRMFPKIKERIPDANLHIFYGFDNISKYADPDTPIDKQRNTINDYMRLMSQDGVEWHGRLGQKELYREWFKTGVWAYPTSFTETSCITSMEAQACGAIPVTNPFWALKDNIMSGSLIDGEPTLDALTQMKYIEEIVYWMTIQEEGTDHDTGEIIRNPIRTELMKQARKRFDWDNIVRQYLKLAV